MNKTLTIFAAVLVAAFSLSAVAGNVDLPIESKKLKKRINEAGNRDLDSFEMKTIYKDYQDNEVAADNKYKNKWFVATGRISGISKDFMGKPKLSFSLDNYELAYVYADLFSEQICGVSKEKGITTCSAVDRAAKLKKGQKIDLECKGGGLLLNSVMLRECLISE